jgi:hypothetical protein
MSICPICKRADAAEFHWAGHDGYIAGAFTEALDAPPSAARMPLARRSRARIVAAAPHDPR